jgi:hypothetical protein
LKLLAPDSNKGNWSKLSPQRGIDAPLWSQTFDNQIDKCLKRGGRVSASGFGGQAAENPPK